MAQFPQSETIGLFNLTAPAPVIEAGARIDSGHGWFTLQVPNMIWFLAVLLLIVVAMFLPFPAHEVKMDHAGTPEGAAP